MGSIKGQGVYPPFRESCAQGCKAKLSRRGSPPLLAKIDFLIFQSW